MAGSSTIARAEHGRRYLSRVVRYLAAEAGIRQFLDIGTRLPTSPNVHEVAQGIIPEARIVYVDNDHENSRPGGPGNRAKRGIPPGAAGRRPR